MDTIIIAAKDTFSDTYIYFTVMCIFNYIFCVFTVALINTYEYLLFQIDISDLNIKIQKNEVHGVVSKLYLFCNIIVDANLRISQAWRFKFLIRMTKNKYYMKDYDKNNHLVLKVQPAWLWVSIEVTCKKQVRVLPHTRLIHGGANAQVNFRRI